MEPLTFTLLVGLAIGHLTFLIKYTDFIVEYAQLLRLERFFCVKQYKQWKQIPVNADQDYPIFIREMVKEDHSRFKKWAAALFGCGFCFSTFICVWLSILSFSYWFPIIALASAGIAGITFSLKSLLYKKINS